MDHDDVDLTELRRNLELAASMLDAVYTDETRYIQTQCRLPSFKLILICFHHSTLKTLESQISLEMLAILLKNNLKLLNV